MLRYLKIYFYCICFSIGRSMEFRVDFWFRILMDITYYLVSIFFFQVIFLHTGLLAGWSEQEVMIFIATVFIVDGLHMTLFSSNMWWLPIYVNRGDLDYYLVRPVSSLFILSLRDFAVNSFINLFMAFVFFLWAISRYEGSMELINFVVFFLLIINGTLLSYLVRMLFLLPVFWTHSVRGFETIYWPMTRLMERPDGIFFGWTRTTLLTILPFALMASIPARMLFEGVDYPIMIYSLCVSAVLFSAVIILWSAGLKSYSSASS